jgi:hypothetical protein
MLFKHMEKTNNLIPSRTGGPYSTIVFTSLYSKAIPEFTQTIEI